MLNQRVLIVVFVRQLIRLRVRFASANDRENQNLTEFLRRAEIHWHGIRLNEPDWGEDSRSLFGSQDDGRLSGKRQVGRGSY